MHSLAWLGFGKSLAHGSNEVDTVTLTGFGVWEKDGRRSLQPFAAQICTNPEDAYVGIQVNASDVSNVNTKPMQESQALP